MPAVLFSFPISDADLGWHLRYGESFLNTGRVMRDNQFSWVMPDYRWANHSWGFDVLEATLFGGHRFWLLSLVGGLVIATSFVILLPSSMMVASISALALNLYVGNEILNTGFKSSLLSLLFTAILWKIIQGLHKPSRYYYFLPALFLIWANIHGQFIFGLGILGLSILPRFRQSNSIFVFVGCILVTFINPFGVNLWQTVLSHFNSPELKGIYEWMPLALNTPLGVIFIMYLGFLGWGIKATRPSWSIVLPLIATALMALSSRRMIPFMFLLSFPLFTTTIDALVIKRMKISPQPQSIYIVLTLCFLSSIYFFTGRNIFSQRWDTYCQTEIFCSEAAVNFIRQHHLTGKLWNSYRLGGYLDYRLPELKTMIDGRMTLWRDNQGVSAFEQYSTMVYTLTGSRQLFMKMDPDLVLIQPQYPLAHVLSQTEKWPIIFQDDHVLLFQNPRSSTPSAPTR